MNLIVGAPSWLVLLLALALLAAAAEDAIRLRISNLTCAAVLAGALLAMVLQGFSLSLWQNLALCIGILSIGTPMFAAGWMGGGDVKLLAALGVWLDLQSAIALLAAVFLAGGAIAAIYIAVRRIRGAPKEKRASGRIPYGLAIVAGAAFVFGLQLSQARSDPYGARDMEKWRLNGVVH
jgi:prepilin peptidase CpaA